MVCRSLVKRKRRNEPSYVDPEARSLSLKFSLEDFHTYIPEHITADGKRSWWKNVFQHLAGDPVASGHLVSLAIDAIRIQSHSSVPSMLNYLQA